MEPSKITVNYFRKKLKRQKRRTFLMFIIGLLLGSGVAFNVYYWYPLLQKKMTLPNISQFPTNNSLEETTTTSTKEEIAETSESTEEDVAEEFIPRTVVSDGKHLNPKYNRLNQELEKTVSESNPSGTILVVKDNQVILNNNYGMALETSTDSINSTYMIASVQKMITSILIMNLIDEGKLTLDTTLSTFYPEIPNSENITIDQLLSMTSELKLENKLKNSQSKEDSINHVINNVTYQPLEKWAYSDVNFFILALIIEKVSLTSYEENFNELIKKPLKLEHTGFYQVDNLPSHLIPAYKTNDFGEISGNGQEITASAIYNEFGTGSMYLSTGDMLTITQALFDGKLVSRDVLETTYKRKGYQYPYTYKAGFYDGDNNYYGHGVFRGYEPTLMLNRDGSSAVIYFSNTYKTDKSNSALVKQMFNQVIQYKATEN